MPVSIGYSTAKLAQFLGFNSVLPSITTESFKEPWGLVVNEAFYQGVPVLATTAVGVAAGGLVQDGVNGFIVPERNSEALARRVQFVLDLPEVRDQLALNAREAVAHWTNELMVAGFREAIGSVAFPHQHATPGAYPSKEG